jgi:tetratricopeptide (TPR) repeat protein
MKTEPSSPIPAYFYGWALQHAGKMDEGQMFIDRATMMPLADEQMRYALLIFLEEAGQYTDASLQRALQLISGSFDSGYVGESVLRFGIADALIQEQYERAVHYAERSRLNSIQKDIYLVEPRGYLLRSGQILQIRTLEYHHTGETDKAVEAVKRFARMLPSATMEFAVELKDLGANEAYQAAFDTSYEIMAAVCEKYPKAAETHNALAWQTAICREKLEEGLKLATIATELIPDSPEYLDTLAEIHFQLKHDDLAIDLMKRSIEMDPENPYYPRQLKRFEAGDRESPAE